VFLLVLYKHDDGQAKKKIDGVGAIIMRRQFTV